MGVNNAGNMKSSTSLQYIHNVSLVHPFSHE
jgi:hypothetical protein